MAPDRDGIMVARDGHRRIQLRRHIMAGNRVQRIQQDIQVGRRRFEQSEVVLCDRRCCELRWASWQQYSLPEKVSIVFGKSMVEDRTGGKWLLPLKTAWSVSTGELENFFFG